ncbi:InlB B-repeat-containing protein [bacterium]|nr:InlB B-repeat-containing protein [bacterium]
MILLAGCGAAPAPENHAPTFTVNLPASLSGKVNSPIEFSVTANDEEGDPIAYGWQESSDNGASWKNIGGNSNKCVVTKTSSGVWKVKVGISDNLGGNATSNICTATIATDPIFNAALLVSVIQSTKPGEVKFTVNGSYSEGNISLAELYYTTAEGNPTGAAFASTANPTLPWDKTMTGLSDATYFVRARLTAADGAAKWSEVKMFAIDPAPITYNIAYDGNGNTSGSVPADSTSYASGSTVTVKGNEGALAKPGYSFDGWNTAANGSGTKYASGDTFSIMKNATLYAQWKPNELIYADPDGVMRTYSPSGSDNDLGGQGYGAKAIGFRPDGTLVYVASNGIIRTYAASSSDDFLAGQDYNAIAIGFRPDGTLVYVASDGVMRTYSSSGSDIALAGQDYSAIAIGFRPDGTLVYADSDGVMRTYSPSGSDNDLGGQGYGAKAIGFRPDGTLVYVASNGIIRTYAASSSDDYLAGQDYNAIAIAIK